MKGLYPKLVLLIGGVFAVLMVAIVVFVYVSGSRQIEREWLARAETLNRMAYEALYASLAHGGGQMGNRQVIARLQEMGAFTNVHVVKGDPVIQQFGINPDAPPLDDLEQRALAGEEVGQVRREGGYRVVRYVTPLRMEAECQQCHEGPVGAINGVISTEISLHSYESALRLRRNVLIVVLVGGLLALGLLTFYALRQMVIRPLQTIQQGTSAIAQGELGYRLQVHTGDELESLADEFNRMAQRLQTSYGQIAEEQSRILAAIEASQDAIWISDANRRVAMVNSAMERLLGRRRGELLGQTCCDLLRVHDANGVSICDTACSFLGSNAKSGRIEGYISAASGEEAWVEISYGRVSDTDRQLSGGVHIVRDLTQRKEVEQLKDEFISMVSHELRTPLNHIKGFATTLLQTDVEWDLIAQRDFLGSINREADRLTDLVEKILHLSRLEVEGFPMDCEWWQIDDLVDGALQRRRILLTDRQVGLELAPDLPTLYVDGREIEVVLMNLIENAVKYSDPGTPITVTTERRSNQVVFGVTDQGVGIPAEHLERIFERFYRVGSQGPHVPGTGLGLAICRRIVEAHHGHIWAESTPGIGSRFFFSLPVRDPEVSSSPAQDLEVRHTLGNKIEAS
jgi:two-component system phosphate regulon sensor histidine kinase PhoR